MKRHYTLMLIGMLLFSGCANRATEVIPTTQPADTKTPLPPTDTPEPAVSPTPQPPTDTPEPTATATTAYTPTPEIKTERVEVPYEDRIIRGTLVGDGEIVVVLAPMFGENRSSWIAFAKHLASLGHTALAFDFPGFGASTGEFSFTATTFDALAVIDFLLEQGFERIVCMGASIGASACYEVAVLRPNLAGLVVISASVETTSEEAAILLMPKLLVTGDEPDVKGPMKENYQLLPAPKQFELINEKRHGTEMLNTGDELRDMLVEFLENLR
jgi:pimeloyl-ACP methyl ester carboxylesterase